ncbi:MAG: hypothetical protein J6K78_04810 [Tidjanibacter sp.]|nr:hypothetical protein [Tidjanibacter sp.]
MQLLYRNRLHWADIVMFIGIGLLLLGFAIWGLFNMDFFEPEDRPAPYILLGVGVLTIGLVVVFMPRWVGVNNDYLVVRTSLRAIRIPLKEIASVEPCHYHSLVRSSGVRFGGVQMSVGKYYNRLMGSFEMYTTSRSNMVLVTTLTGRKIIINCPIDRLTEYLSCKRVRG